jgi:hypothetical protein
LDTREKIVPADSIHSAEAKVVIGYFDPLYAANVHRLQEICNNGERITVIVADRSSGILPLRARAEMVASLRCVRHVIIDEGDPIRIAARLGAREVIDEREADETRAAGLSAHIVERYQVK